MDGARRILVVYDQVLMAQSLAGAIFERLGHGVDAIETCDDALRTVRMAPPDLVLLDLYMRQSAGEAYGRYSHGMQLLRTLRQERPDMPVLMMSFAKTPFAVWDTVRRRGAAGFVSAEDRLETICTALDGALRDGLFLTQQDQHSIAEIDALRLTPIREETIKLLGQMANPQQMAAHLGVSVDRVYERLADLYERFGVNGYGALLVKARELGFFPAHP